MTAWAIALLVMVAIVGGVFLFGVFWLRVERRQAKEKAMQLRPASPIGQEALSFSSPEGRSIAATVRPDR
jgi:O-antigen/teichoic acid export membrane protein